MTHDVFLNLEYELEPWCMERGWGSPTLADEEVHASVPPALVSERGYAFPNGCRCDGRHRDLLTSNSSIIYRTYSMGRALAAKGSSATVEGGSRPGWRVQRDAAPSLPLAT